MHRRYNPGDALGATHGCEPDWRGGIFDVVAVSFGNMELKKDGLARRKDKTIKVCLTEKYECEGGLTASKVFRIEGESDFLNKESVFRFEANGRLFSGIGGSIIKTPDITQLAYRPEGNAAPVQLKNSVFYLVSRDATRKEEYDSPKLLEYRDAVDELVRSSGKPIQDLVVLLRCTDLTAQSHILRYVE